MATINFLYRSVKNKSNIHLRLLFRNNSTDFVFGTNTKLEISKEYWSKYHRMKRPKDINIINLQTEIKYELNKIENHILNSFNNFNPDLIDKKWLEVEMNYYYNPPQKAEALTNELLKYIDVYIDYKKHNITKATITKFNGIKKLITKYQINKKTTVLISDVNNSFKKDFEDFCLQDKYAPNTIARAIRFIKTFCKHAQSNGLETSYQLDSIKTKNIKVESIYLTFEDLKKIEETDYTESLDNAKDWLIISCYTGQRVSDFMRFTKEMIRYEKNKNDGILKPLIEFTQKKTNKMMTVPLHKKVIEILDKRNGEFPYSLSDQKYNKHIKEVCRLATIKEIVSGSKLLPIEKGSKITRKQSGTFEKWELVTSHIGRRSFASNYYGEIPTNYLIYITGHSTETMFLNYIGKSNKDKAMEMTNFF
ncbi:tyrosine-type recombinase/integrase [Polaribacter sp. IC073]|uniref:tyrosine-type recombinase/integrase n=1 Tax=Polaribacter sp. IC073 TaxID=2508540 RepID=UPI0011BE93F9|nr:phage integrase SAM-like domain-containing protein [Polaribacter sp. IC073]TXD48664.1 site-specific integrase [Polaribacter sp. IC073]